MRRLLMAGLLVFSTGHFAFGAVDWELEVTDGTNTALINAGGTLVLTNSASGFAAIGSGATAGTETFFGNVGNYTLNVTTGEGSPFLSVGSLSLNTTNSTSGNVSGPLTIEWSENGLTVPAGSYTMNFSGTLTSGAGSTVSNAAYESNTNGFFAQTNTIGTIGPYSGSATPGTTFASPNISGSAPVSGTYSLTEVITLNGVGQTNLNGAQANLDPASTPEPASVVLLGSVISMTVLVLRRRKVAKKVLID